MNANKQDAGGLPNEMGFEQWYAMNAFDYPNNPIGCRDCSIARKAWHAALEAARDGELCRASAGREAVAWQCRAASGFELLELAAIFESCVPFLPPVGQRNITKAVAELRALSRGVPEGMVLVPNVMTRAMLDAMRRSMGDHSETFEDWWECEGQYAVRHYYAAIAAQRKEG